MSGLAFSLVVAVSLLGEGRSYHDAHSSSQEQGKPLLVLVGADWCPGCRTLKHHTLPKLNQAGKLQPVEFAVVDSDRESALARRLMRGNSIPQLVLFTRTADGWKRQQLTGAQAEQSIESFVSRALADHIVEKKPALATTDKADLGAGGQ